MPKNSAIGVVTAFFAVVIGFTLIWHIWWLAVLGLLGVFATLLIFAFRDEVDIFDTLTNTRVFGLAIPGPRGPSPRNGEPAGTFRSPCGRDK